MRKASALLLLVAILVVTAACGSDDDDAAPATTPPATEETETDVAATTEEEPDPCAKDELGTVVDGSLTMATDNPAFPPWFQDADGAPWDPTTPATGLGYEAAVAYGVAEQLGFSQDEVRWVVVPFNNIFRPGPKDFDFDINQVSYLPERDEAVDFSDSYYDVEQAVVTLKGSEFAGAASLADLQGAKLGAQVGTTSYNAIVDLIEPSQDPAVFDTNNDAITALKNKQIDGIVVDFPSTGYITAVQVPNATVVGRLPAGEEYFGLVFEEGNPLRDCVNQAIAALHEDGSIEQFQEEWINTSAPPVLE